MMTSEDHDEQELERLFLPSDVNGEPRKVKPGMFQSLKDFRSLGLTLVSGLAVWAVVIYVIWRNVQ